MLDRDGVLHSMRQHRLVAIIRLRHEAPLARVAEALVEGGVTALEFTLTSPGAVAAIDQCRARFGDRVLVGAGTVPRRLCVDGFVAAGRTWEVMSTPVRGV